MELKGPVAPVTKIAKESSAKFERNEDNSLTCERGYRSDKNTILNDGKLQSVFSKAPCQECDNKDRCKPEPRGKRVYKRPVSTILEARRKLMQTDEYRVDMFKRNGIEGTISGLVRGQGIRQSRFRGKAKVRLQLLFSAAAANIKRLTRHLELSGLQMA